jgi:isopenicillin N synthase-like dioxygenase
LEETALDKEFQKPLTDITIQHYPAQPAKSKPEQTLYAHADYGAFTLLLQNKVAGLEVLNANGIWIPAPPKDHTFIVNTGSYMEVLSNSRFPSTVHRVFSNPGIERFSLPFFFSPDPSATIVPHPTLLQKGEKPKWEPFVIGQRHVIGMMYRRPEHPFVEKMNSLGLNEKDYKYEMLTRPIPSS